ncbi:MAG: GGDEF domain-containing protein [Gammaproteobacteria bacterium]
MRAEEAKEEMPSESFRAVEDFDAATILAGLPMGVLALDAQGRVCWANDTAAELFGVEPGMLIGHALGGLPAKRRLRLSKTTEKIRVTPRSGQTRWVECIMQRINAGPVVAVACLTDVTAYEERQQALMSGIASRTADRVNHATGLLTREALQRELLAQVSRSRRYRNPLSVVMLKLAPTRPGGDRVTPLDRHRLSRIVARMMRERLRWVDVVGQPAPDEFLLILPETSLDAARQVVRKLKGQLKTLDQNDPLLLEGRAVMIDAVEWQGGEDAHALLERLARLVGAPGAAGQA